MGPEEAFAELSVRQFDLPSGCPLSHEYLAAPEETLLSRFDVTEINPVPTSNSPPVTPWSCRQNSAVESLGGIHSCGASIFR